MKENNFQNSNGSSDARPSDSSTYLPPWEGRAILLVDLDAFFAAVEQLDHPGWRGKPVIVGGDSGKRGVVSTASYEARKFGVHSAMASATARRLCPDAIWTQGHYARYKEVSQEVMNILYDETPFVQQVSVDEAFMDISPNEHNSEHPVVIAQRIQARIEKLGVTASVGLGTSKTVAKIASDMDKPKGMTVVYPGRERDFLAPLPVRVLSGIGPSAEKELMRHGIKTLGELAHTDVNFLIKLFGKSGSVMHVRACGGDDAPIELDDEVKSVSNEISFAEDLETREEIESALQAISAKVGRRLRTKGLKGHTLSLKIRYGDRSVHSAQTQLESNTDDDLLFAPYVLKLLDQVWRPGLPVRLLGVGMTGFTEKSTPQERLFDLEDDAATEDGFEPLVADNDKREQLIKATDKVKDRFGEKAVRFGHEVKTGKRTTGSGSKNPADYR